MNVARTGCRLLLALALGMAVALLGPTSANAGSGSSADPSGDSDFADIVALKYTNAQGRVTVTTTFSDADTLTANLWDTITVRIIGSDGKKCEWHDSSTAMWPKSIICPKTPIFPTVPKCVGMRRAEGDLFIRVSFPRKCLKGLTDKVRIQVVAAYNGGWPNDDGLVREDRTARSPAVKRG